MPVEHPGICSDVCCAVEYCRAALAVIMNWFAGQIIRLRGPSLQFLTYALSHGELHHANHRLFSINSINCSFYVLYCSLCPSLNLLCCHAATWITDCIPPVPLNIHLLLPELAFWHMLNVSFARELYVTVVEVLINMHFDLKAFVNFLKLWCLGF